MSRSASRTKTVFYCTTQPGNGEDTQIIKKIRTYDKLKALDALARHLGFFERDNKQNNPDFINDELHPEIAYMLLNPDKFTD